MNLGAPLLSAQDAGLDWNLLERIDAGRVAPAAGDFTH